VYAIVVLKQDAAYAILMAAIGSAAAQQTEGYRALVCLFMYGGNDHTNTVLPYDLASYNEYYNARSSIAIAREELTATSLGAVASQGGREFALHPALINVSRLYRERNAAVVANVGPLVVPTTKAQYQQKSVPLPPRLFSHNDQQSAWQAYAASGEGARYGWGGTLGDQLADTNSTTAFTCISAAGNAVFLSGRNMVQYQVSTSGALTMNAITNAKVGACVPNIVNDSGNPQKFVMNRAPTAGKIPKLITPETNASSPMNTRKRLL
jgi:uncharacterized protein (DUF1501 family)